MTKKESVYSAKSKEQILPKHSGVMQVICGPCICYAFNTYRETSPGRLRPRGAESRPGRHKIKAAKRKELGIDLPDDPFAYRCDNVEYPVRHDCDKKERGFQKKGGRDRRQAKKREEVKDEDEKDER